jgi:two-component system NtrC family sensor kinase
MHTPRQSAVRLLQLMMLASIALPAAFFVFATWLNYRYTHAVADERIDRSLDILSEHSLKVFQTVERTMAEVDEVVRGLSDDQIRAQEKSLHERLAAIVAAVPQLHAVRLVDRNAQRLVTSLAYPASSDRLLAGRSFFRVEAQGDVGTYVSEVMQPLGLRRGTTHFFVLSRRRPSADGTFNGITAVGVRPDYFQQFYARLGRGPGRYYAMMRSDGAVLARHPRDANTPLQLDLTRSIFAKMRAHDPLSGLYTTMSPLDGVDRRLGYRKLPGFPIYVFAGIETSAIAGEWQDQALRHLYFGVPATLAMFLLLLLALRRTRRLHDEAERREAAEDALRHAQRLEAIGQLTGGIAHDFNNLMMVVSGNVQRMRRRMPAGEKEKYARYLDTIATASHRGENLTRQLLTFSRRQTLLPEVIDLKKWLPELRDLLSRSLRGDIQIDVAVPEADCAVKVDQNELELALLNLAVNARDAMRHGGTLSIAAHAVELADEVGQEGLRGDFVCIRVADTGAGIPTDVLPRVFEPYFTTKDVGSGTGLGLSQVYGFAKQSGGAATISSTPGAGTAVALYLPRSHEVAAKTSPPVSRTTAPPSVAELPESRKVLLVEDNADVADVCMSYFQQIGYEVRRCQTGQEALEALENDSGFELVFSDILMPGLMNGLDLARLVRERFPQLSVVLTTGYSESAQVAVRAGFVVLQKPFDISAFDRAVSKALGGTDEERAAEQLGAMTG